MSLTKYAEAELARIPHDEDGLQSLMDKNILEIVKIFGEQGHSGFLRVMHFRFWSDCYVSNLSRH